MQLSNGRSATTEPAQPVSVGNLPPEIDERSITFPDGAFAPDELVGPVPLENFIGRADLMFFSVALDEGQSCRLINPLSWPGCIRWRRLFSLVR